MRYIRHLLNDIPSAELVAVCRTHPKRAAEFLESEGRKLKFFDDYRELLKADLEAVVIVTPTGTHRQIAIEAAESGKHLLVEKPIARNAREAKEIIHAAEKEGVGLMVAQTLRYNPTILRIKNELHSLGQIISLHMGQRLEPPVTSWLLDKELAGGGVVLNTGVHIFDTIRFLSAQEIKEVNCTTRRILNPVWEDSFTAMMELENGTLVSVDASRLSKTRTRVVQVIAEEGHIVGETVRDMLFLYNSEGEHRLEVEGERRTIVTLMKEFIRALKKNEEMPIPGEEGMRAVEIADACYRSVERGGSVKLIR